MKLFILLSSLLILFLVIIPKNAMAVVFSSDNVYLYTSGKRVNTDAIYLVSYKSWSDICKKGVCIVGQQFYPITIYLPKNNSLMTQPEFQKTQVPYVGPKYGPEAGRAKDEWANMIKTNYLKYLEENGISSEPFNPGPSNVMKENIIGKPRSYNFDVESGKITEHFSIIPSSESLKYFFIQLLNKLFPSMGF